MLALRDMSNTAQAAGQTETTQLSTNPLNLSHEAIQYPTISHSDG